VGISSRAGQTVLRALVSDRMQPGVVYTTFHFPESGANVITTDSSDWATNCPEYKVTAVQVVKVMQPSALGGTSGQAAQGGVEATAAQAQSPWQRDYAQFNRRQLELLAQGQAVGVGK